VDEHATIMIAVERDGRILLIRRLNEPSRGLWALPGGHVDDGETPAQAARREASEEVPGTLTEEKELTTFIHEVPEGEKRHPEPHSHECHLFRGRLEGDARTGSDAGEHMWIRMAEALAREDLETTGSTRYALVWLLRERGSGGKG